MIRMTPLLDKKINVKTNFIKCKADEVSDHEQIIGQV